MGGYDSDQEEESYQQRRYEEEQERLAEQEMKDQADLNSLGYKPPVPYGAWLGKGKNYE